MRILLLLIPVLTSIFGLLIYRLQSTKKEIFRLNAVQFVYLFLLAPTMFVWLKSFIFFILRSEIGLHISFMTMFIIDTTFSVLSFVVFVAIAIHSLTKTFWLKKHHDADFDIYHLSEYFHLWWSHVAIWWGMMVLFVFIAVVNIFVPLSFSMTKYQFYGFLILGSLSGLLLFFVVWLSDASDVLQNSYMRLMKISFVFFFVVNVFLYFVFDPHFNQSKVAFWYVFSLFFSAVVISLFFEKRVKSHRLKNFLTHRGWGENKGVKIFNFRQNK